MLWQGNRHELTAQQLQQIRAQGPAAVVDMNLAREDAAKLHQAGVKRLGTDESAFISVLALRNMYQLQATFDEYQKVSAVQLSPHCFIFVFAVYLLVLYIISDQSLVMFSYRHSV